MCDLSTTSFSSTSLAVAVADVDDDVCSYLSYYNNDVAEDCVVWCVLRYLPMRNPIIGCVGYL